MGRVRRCVELSLALILTAARVNLLCGVEININQELRADGLAVGKERWRLPKASHSSLT